VGLKRASRASESVDPLRREPWKFVTLLPKRFRESVLLRFLLAELVVGLFLLVLVLAIYRQDVINQGILLDKEAEHVLDLQHELLLSELRGVQSDLLFLANQEALQHFLSGNGPARAALEREYINFAQRQDLYDQIRFLDTTGKELVRINYHAGESVSVPQDELQTKASRYYFRQSFSLNKDEVFVSPFDLNVEHGTIEQPIEPVIRFATPVYDRSGSKRGLLVLNYLGAPMLNKLREIAASFRGETMLLNPDGEYLESPHRAHAWGWLINHDHSFRQDFPDVWRQAKSLDSTQIRSEQDRFSFRWLSPRNRLSSRQPVSMSLETKEDPSGLVLVARISAAAANAHSQELLRRLGLMLAGVLVVVSLLTYYWARSAGVRVRHERLIAESETRLRQLSSALLETQEAERRTLSRMLHDELGQLVTAIRVDLGTLEKEVLNPKSHHLLRRIIEESEMLLSSLHEIASQTRPSVLDDLGLSDAVDSFISEYQHRTGVSVISLLEFDQQHIPEKTGENAYRIVVEALSNVARHAKVDEVRMRIAIVGESLRISVQDAGIGFDPEALGSSTRLGVLGMRERAELLQGTFHLTTGPGQGTQIVVELPLVDQSASQHQSRGL
jgi:signal transduction histidine kinase